MKWQMTAEKVDNTAFEGSGTECFSREVKIIDRGQTIAIVSTVGGMSNAKLIQSAPKLLATCRKMVEYLTTVDRGDPLASASLCASIDSVIRESQ